VTGERVFRRSATGGGDAKKLRHAGIPTVEFGLGTDTVHGVDEYTTVDALVGNATVYTRLPYAYAERASP
jgi:succinyl-diaminopimelate desuccinylase